MAVYDVSQASVEGLAAQYISIPTGQGSKIVDGFSSKWSFLNASVQLMALTFLVAPNMPMGRHVTHDRSTICSSPRNTGLTLLTPRLARVNALTQVQTPVLMHM